MRDWIVGYRKAAINSGPGADADTFQRLNDLPEELRDLYAEMNGAELPGGVTLFPLEAEDTRAVEQLPGSAWRFGAKGDSQELLSGSKAQLLDEAADATTADWVHALSDDTWLYASWDAQKGALKAYRTLEQMLATMVPPTQVEEFGDTTFARALTAVAGALKGLREPTETKVPLKKAATKTAAKARKAKKGPKGKSATKAKPSKRAAPRRAAPKRAKASRAKTVSKSRTRGKAVRRAAPTKKRAASAKRRRR